MCAIFVQVRASLSQGDFLESHTESKRPLFEVDGQFMSRALYRKEQALRIEKLPR